MTSSQFAPIWVSEVELSAPLGDLIAPVRADGTQYSRAQILVRLHGSPLGFIRVLLDDACLGAEQLVREICAPLGRRIERHLLDDGLEPVELTVGGIAAGLAPCLEPGPGAAVTGPVSVVIPTKDRPDLLQIAIDSVLSGSHRELDLIVVDNNPSTDATRDLVAAIEDPRVQYVREPVASVARARNRGVQVARTEVVAFADDDVRADREWLRALLLGFSRAPNVGCVTGLVPAAELETPAQLYLDQRVNWSSFYDRELFDLAENSDHGPMFPFSAGQFGTGANFAVKRAAWQALGGSDEVLGQGIAGEDIDFFLRVVLSGMTLAYEPSAIVWHPHHRDTIRLRSQLRDYGAGLGAYSTKHLLNLRTGPQLLWRVPRAWRRSSRDQRDAVNETGEDLGLKGVERRGMLRGPWVYLRARAKHRLARQQQVR